MRQIPSFSSFRAPQRHGTVAPENTPPLGAYPRPDSHPHLNAASPPFRDVFVYPHAKEETFSADHVVLLLPRTGATQDTLRVPQLRRMMDWVEHRQQA